MKDHLEKIEESVIHQFGLNSFHLVAHSMGCLIALALAAKYSKSVKTITLVAPVSDGFFLIQALISMDGTFIISKHKTFGELGSQF